MTGRRLRFLACLAALGLCLGPLAACGRSDDDGLAWRPPGDLPCGKVGTAPPPARPSEGALHVVPLAEFAVPDPISAADLFGHYLTYSPRNRSIVVCDLDTGRVATVDRRGPGSEAVLSDPRGDGDTVVYLEMARLPSLGGSTEWALKAVDLGSGSRTVIARSRGDDGPDAQYYLLPRPVISGPWVLWSEATSGGDRGEGVLYSHDLRTGERRVLARDIRLPARVEATGGTVIFDGGPDEGEAFARAATPVDLFTVPADGSGSPRLLRSDVWSWYDAASGAVAWAADGDLWWMDLDPVSEPVRAGEGDRPVPGTDFVVTESGFALVVRDLRNPGTPVQLAPRHHFSGAGTPWTAEGDIVAWIGVENPTSEDYKEFLQLSRVERR